MTDTNTMMSGISEVINTEYRTSTDWASTVEKKVEAQYGKKGLELLAWAIL